MTAGLPRSRTIARTLALPRLSKESAREARGSDPMPGNDL
jgi:hypothetical protein